MTNKEKAYDDALERAKKLKETCDSTAVVGWCEYIFPEIRESEDERIRKTIIRFFKDSYPNEIEMYDGSVTVGKALAWLEKQGEHNPANKVKPKFKVGDWIIFNGLTLYINEVVEGYYRTISIGGIPNSYDWDIDDIARLWTIQDAKDGDVLCEGDNVDGDTIFIFKERLNDESIITYCDYDKGELNDSCNLFCYNVMPATKEQRDLLFKKMKEAGYEWNEEKKDPKKIVAPKFNIHDCVVKKHNSNINDFGYFIITDITDGKYWYNDRIICDIREQDEWELYEPVRQKPTAWSDEDERIIKEIDEIIYECPYCESKEEISNWLKSIKQRIGG